ncbi:MAG: neutral/alkaline non-lysosomal ceramidase N-terminal domain-containing protein [Bacteroidales bacterium]|nr:neutral/alkaline non-lysosomal ceramidase N-terminal domain-containing protein [Bacteroidales bacterium]MBQ2229529.1 neutral/alkaline non-lysosomal ceramidase N-terminal domain-containing protein [Bacteroidales bacterium]MBQ4200670.1 neutral/alkaline non-lysosomal ceramidase N-terminal domain-containing protein [Bacteroidales bacterium]
MKYRIGISALSILLLCCLTGCGEKGLTLNYNAADISTTPDEHTMLAGFAARSKLSTELHLPLYTHCLVIGKGEDKVCIISNDLMEISPELSAEWRDEIAEKSGLPMDRIFMHCIHTHSAPRNGGVRAEPGGSNYSHKERLHRVLVENAVKTITDEAAFRPFKMEVGKGRTSINGNRCEKRTGPVDRSVYVVRFLDRKGKPIVSLMNLACHPVCMGAGSLLVSSDYPGVASKILKEAWGGDVFQLTGAAGNMDPAEGPKMVEYAEECGRCLADSVLRIKFDKVKPTGEFKVFNNIIGLPYRIDHITAEAVEEHAAEISKWDKTVSATWKDDVEGWKELILSRIAQGNVPDHLIFHLGAVNINGIIFFFTQGEPFCEYQMEARQKFPDRTIIFAGYTNGQNSYLPSAHAFEYRKGYEYEIDQMHVYIKAPYPLSEYFPQGYAESIEETIRKVL